MSKAVRNGMELIRREYGLSVKRGDDILVDDKKGKVVGECGGYLKIKLSGERLNSLFHPRDDSIMYLT